ncbi:hypothetical protein [Deinococcus hopiensis]|uniref:hypothetical protein n=1 Tax=Deinococcus hopiensis TaxID=309885 RepID=UPI000A045A61|nr:hypothetical protein [Deinococcus hopiensis]
MLREQLALVIAQENNCGCCFAAHTLIGGLLKVPADELQRNRVGQLGNPKGVGGLRFARALPQRYGVTTDAELAFASARLIRRWLWRRTQARWLPATVWAAPHHPRAGSADARRPAGGRERERLTEGARLGDRVYLADAARQRELEVQTSPPRAVCSVSVLRETWPG